eukprot:gene6316-4546_t
MKKKNVWPIHIFVPHNQKEGAPSIIRSPSIASYSQLEQRTDEAYKMSGKIKKLNKWKQHPSTTPEQHEGKTTAFRPMTCARCQWQAKEIMKH